MASFDTIKETKHKKTIRMSTVEYKIEIREVLRDASNAIDGYQEKTTYYIKINWEDIWWVDDYKDIEQVYAYCTWYIIWKDKGISDTYSEIYKWVEDIPWWLPHFDN